MLVVKGTRAAPSRVQGPSGRAADILRRICNAISAPALLRNMLDKRAGLALLGLCAARLTIEKVQQQHPALIIRYVASVRAHGSHGWDSCLALCFAEPRKFSRPVDVLCKAPLRRPKV